MEQLLLNRPIELNHQLNTTNNFYIGSTSRKKSLRLLALVTLRMFTGELISCMGDITPHVLLLTAYINYILHIFIITYRETILVGIGDLTEYGVIF